MITLLKTGQEKRKGNIAERNTGAAAGSIRLIISRTGGYKKKLSTGFYTDKISGEIMSKQKSWPVYQPCQ